ncbi:SH3 domain-containing protein [Clostridium sp. SHJSY1]|uniref:SH3 domain-containing protein n=1 Tax=Clostridium sp. SHJSY1 TaxID=2942483 RepID=UPI0028765F96|nr:SH3 domain-containing protein [Clostridium sp. SHJSY1]MDS0526633.1 SH3 domain-containing protein [Clostridium sp. SHJSY1]
MGKTKNFTTIRFVSVCMLIAFMVNVIPANIVQASILLKTEKNIKLKFDSGNVLHYDGKSDENTGKEENSSEKVVEKNQPVNDVDTNSKKETEVIKQEVSKEPKKESVESKNTVNTKQIESKEQNQKTSVKEKNEILNSKDKNLTEEKNKTSEEKDKKVVENFDMFDTAIVGLLGEENTKLTQENILKVKTKIPNGKGIWIVEKDRESVLNLINQIADKEYYIDESGFLRSKETIKNVGSKSYSEVLDGLINSDKKLIVGRSAGWYEYDVESQKAVNKTFDNNRNVISIGETTTDKLVILDDNNQNNEMSLILINELVRVLRGKNTESIKEKVTEEIKRDSVDTKASTTAKKEETSTKDQNPIGADTSEEKHEAVDNKDKDIVKNFDMLDTAIVGLLGEKNKELTYENILKVKNKIPEGSGVWVKEENREYVLKLINQIADKEYYINENGFLKSKEIAKNSGSKATSEIIDSLINSDKMLIIGRSDGWDEYDTQSQKVIHKTFSDTNKGVTIGGKATDQLVILSDSDNENSNSEMSIVLIHELIHGLRGQQGNKERLEEELYAGKLENEIRKELNLELRDLADIEEAYNKNKDSYYDDYKEKPFEYSAGTYATVKLQDPSSSLNFRSGPSTDSGIIGSLPHGASVKILGQSGDWYNVEYNGLSGYVRGDYLIQGTASGATSGTVKLQDISSSVNIRSGASTDTSVVGSLTHGTVVQILGTEGNWYRISYNGVVGYVRGDFIVAGASSSSASGAGTIKLQDPSSSVNVRSGASTDTSVIGSLTHGAQVQILGTENNWYKISYNGGVGYVRNDFVVAGGSTGSASGTGTIKLQDPSSSVNVRNGASTSTSVIGSLTNGAVVQILGTESNWYKISYNGSVGYVRNDFVVAGGSTGSASGTGTIKLQDPSSSVNVRNGASTSTSVIGSLTNGAVVQILGTESNWYKISYNGGVGYVRNDFIVAGGSIGSASGTGTIRLQDPSSSLNFRSGPSTSTSVIGSLRHGTVVQILGTESNWYKISYNGQIGYVRNDFLVPGGSTTIDSQGGMYGASVKDGSIRYYSQDDPRYGNVMYSNHGDATQTIAASACGPAAFSIVVSTLNNIDVPPTEMCSYALAKGFRTYNSGTNSGLFSAAASDPSNTRYNLNTQYVSGTSGAKSLLSDGSHLVIVSMAPGHVTRQGHYIVLAGWTTINGKVYFKVYDPHRWNEYYIYDGEIIDDVKDDGFILLSETAIRNEANAFFGFSNKNNSKIDNGQGSSTGGSTSSGSNPSNPGTSVSDSTILRMGSKGEEVKRLQNLLISKGYSCGPYGADGDFGQGTYDAVVAFQKANSLEQDGVVGTDTWAALNGSSGSGSSGGSNNNQGTSTGNQESDNSKDETSFFQEFIDAYKKHQTSGNILYDEINFWTLGTLDSFKAVSETKPFTLENLKANFKLFLNTAPFIIPAGKTIDSFVSGATKYVGSLFAKKVGCTETTVAIDEAAASIVKGATAEVISIGKIEHVLKDHTFGRMNATIGKMMEKGLKESAENLLSQKTFFNPSWSEEKVIDATNQAYKKVLSQGFTNGEHIVKVFDENITVYLENGVFHSAYGDFKLTLADFGF